MTDADLAAELDRIERDLSPPWASGPAATAWHQQFTLSRIGEAQMADNPAIVELVSKHPAWGPEYIERLAAATRGEGRAPSPERAQEIAAKVALDHPAELMELARSAGVQAPVNTAGMSADFVARLQKLGLTDDSV